MAETRAGSQTTAGSVCARLRPVITPAGTTLGQALKEPSRESSWGRGARMQLFQSLGARKG